MAASMKVAETLYYKHSKGGENEQKRTYKYRAEKIRSRATPRQFRRNARRQVPHRDPDPSGVALIPMTSMDDIAVMHDRLAGREALTA